jgi:purine-nucleoside phosphorylase
MEGAWSDLEHAADAVARRAPLRPEIAVVLGSGLGALAEEAAEATVIPYEEIPHFPRSTAPGHAGRLVVGRLAGVPAILFAGRAHLYEGYGPNEVVFGVRLGHLLGARVLIITNAAGGVNTDWEPGTLMLIADHINLTGHNPLVGPNEPRLGTRFPDMSTAYDPGLRLLADRVAGRQDLFLPSGVYLGLLGPNYETPAEIRMARLLGADAVGMSTVLEVIAARHAGMRVLGISCISNMAAGILPQELTEEEVIETAARVHDTFAGLIRGVVAAYGEEVDT